MISILHKLETDIFFVDKPSGMSVHNELGKDLISTLEKQLGKKTHLVHRLDQETSGLICVSTSASGAAEMAKLFQSREIRKFYFGICRGVFKQKSGHWNWPLTDKAEGRKNPQGLGKDRLESDTAFKVVRESAYLSFVEFELFSGRQHQIRKHCAIAKHALLNDSRYGDSSYNQKMKNIYKVDRLLLHSSRLEFPWQNKNIEISSPLPAEFESPAWQFTELP